MNDKLMESLVSKLQEDNLQDYGNTTDYNYFYNKPNQSPRNYQRKFTFFLNCKRKY